MRISLHVVSAHDGVTVLEGSLPATVASFGLRYKTVTGALLRLDGVAAGAFDREHDTVTVAPSHSPRALRLDVELASLPTHGLPSGPGLRWSWLQWTAKRRAERSIEIVEVPAHVEGVRGDLALVGHAHLDIAWLWTFAEGRRKAQRTFANALEMAKRDDSFVFAQSQPELYAAIERDAPDLFAQVREAVDRGSIDTSVAALWVESDANIPSGETLLRQCVTAFEYIQSRFGRTPSVAWLPDSFGFANTIPQLLAHVGIRFFMTTKLQWNDTNRWPYPQFVWAGPDGSQVVAALVDSYDGGPSPGRVARARERGEMLVVGFGDGGGGVNGDQLRAARDIGAWTSAHDWFETVARRADRMPRHTGELYLEQHRGVFTTHHDLKTRRFALEAALDEAEEAVAWCLAVRAPQAATTLMSADLRNAWPPLLRGDFHDLIAGTSIAPAYDEIFNMYERSERIVGRTLESARSVLPRSAALKRDEREVAPAFDGEFYRFANEHLEATLREDGTVVELRVAGGANVVTGANVLRAYRDKPKEWEAWNIDAGYERRPIRVVQMRAQIEDDALIVRHRVGGSTIVQRIALGVDDPFLRVDAAVDWSERRTLLRLEHWLPIATTRATFGTPHGTLDRNLGATTPQERAAFEVPGQRFVRVDGASGGFAMFVTDNGGFSARSLRSGGIRLGCSLLRGTTWPDPNADRGEHRLHYALMPLEPAMGIGAVERVWRSYAYPPRVRLFTSDDPAVLIVACKPADDDDGIIVRVRECDGAQRMLRLRCGGRARQVVSCNGLESALERDCALDDGAIVATLEPYELRTFRVRL